MAGRTVGVRNRLLIFIDITTILVSLLLSRVIRSQFPFFLYELEKLFFMLPYVIVLRILTNVFFEHYNVSYSQILTSDVRGLFVHQLPPTAVLVLLRFLSPWPLIRVPFSMIISEYFITVSGFIITRLLFSARASRGASRGDSVAVFPALVVLSHYGTQPRPALEALTASGRLRVLGVISDRIELWGQEIGGARVIGGPDAVADAVAGQSSARIVFLPGTTGDLIRSVLNESRRAHVLHSVYENEYLRPCAPSDLFETESDPTSVVSVQFPDPGQPTPLIVPTIASAVEEHLVSIAKALSWPVNTAAAQSAFVDMIEFERYMRFGQRSGDGHPSTAAGLVVLPAVAAYLETASSMSDHGATVLFVNPVMEEAADYDSAILEGFSFLEPARSVAMAIFQALHSQRPGTYRYVGQQPIALSEYRATQDLLGIRLSTGREDHDEEEIDVVRSSEWQIDAFPTLWTRNQTSDDRL